MIAYPGKRAGYLLRKNSQQHIFNNFLLLLLLCYYSTVMTQSYTRCSNSFIGGEICAIRKENGVEVF